MTGHARFKNCVHNTRAGTKPRAVVSPDKRKGTNLSALNEPLRNWSSHLKGVFLILARLVLTKA